MGTASLPVPEIEKLFAQLLGCGVRATRVPPPEQRAYVAVSPYHFDDGSLAMVCLTDRRLSLIFAAAIMGTPGKEIEPLLEQATPIHNDYVDGLRECFNVLGGLLNRPGGKHIIMRGMRLGAAQDGLAPLFALDRGRVNLRLDVEGYGAGELELIGLLVADERPAKAAVRAPIPTKNIEQYLSPLIRGLGVQLGAELVISDKERYGVIAWGPRGAPACVAAICQLPLAASLGAAPMMIPAKLALDGAGKGDLTPDIKDGFQEVGNVLTGLFPDRQYAMEGVWWLPGELPVGVKALIDGQRKGPAYEIRIDGYTKGPLALIEPGIAHGFKTPVVR